MIKLSILYPYAEGKRFDMDYYCEKHMPKAQEMLKGAVKKMSVEKGICGAAPGSAPEYIAVGNLYFESLEIFNEVFPPIVPQIGQDIPNFTDTEPVLMISEVII